VVAVAVLVGNVNSPVSKKNTHRHERIDPQCVQLILSHGWHSLRRKFASDLMNQPLKVLCELGGWKTAQTVLQCYQRADEDQLRKALEDRRRVSIPAN